MQSYPTFIFSLVYFKDLRILQVNRFAGEETYGRDI